MKDAQRLLAFFRDNPNKEVCCTVLVAGQFYGTKKIIEYTGRIKNARDILGCTCGENKDACTAPEHIRNVRKGFYKFITPVEPPKTDAVERREEMMTYQEKLAKRAEIAKQWRTASDIRKAQLKAMIYGLGLTKEQLELERDKERIKQTLG